MINDYKCTAEMHKVCSNSSLCHLCDGIRLFKDPIAEKKAKREAAEQRKEDNKTALIHPYLKGKKEGMDFERRVADRWNNHFDKKKKKVGKPRLDVESIMSDEEEVLPKLVQQEKKDLSSLFAPKHYEKEEAQRQIASGALWMAKSDIKLDHALMECKERGSKNKHGEKQITIPKRWLDKEALEAIQEKRDYWYLPFGFKGSDDIYLIKPYDHEIEFVAELRKLREENERLKLELERKKDDV